MRCHHAGTLLTVAAIYDRRVSFAPSTEGRSSQVTLGLRFCMPSSLPMERIQFPTSSPPTDILSPHVVL